MSDDPPDHAPLDYQTPGAPDAGRSQWITDEQAAGKWLVGCLLVLTGVAAVVGAIVTVLSVAVGC